MTITSVDDMFESILRQINSDKGKMRMTIDKSCGKIKLESDDFILDVVVNDKWVGYDFNLNKQLTNKISQGSSLDTDLYRLDYDPHVTEEIYQEVKYFIKSLLTNKLYYGTVNNKAIFARPMFASGDEQYIVTAAPRRKFFALISSEVVDRKTILKDKNLKNLKVT